MRIILLNLLIVICSFAQDAVVESIFSLDKSLESINAGSLKPGQCNTSTNQKISIAKTVIDCECDNKGTSKTFKSFQIKNLKPDELPQSIKKHIPGKAFETGKFNVVLTLPNDNKLFGLWGIVFNEDGDDFGATHGSALSLSSTRDNGMTYSLQGETNLYTKRSGKSSKTKDGRNVYSQNFTNENMINFIVDNIHKDKVLYFKAGVGWIQLDSKKSTGLVQASAQQQAWHKAINTYGFDNEWDGIPIKNGLNANVFLGLQKNILLGSSCRLRMYGQAGAHISSLNDDFVQIEAGSTLYFQKRERNWGLTTGLSANLTSHELGRQFQKNISIGANTKRFGAEVLYHAKTGNLQNHVNYNTLNKNGKIDPTVSLKLKYVFGLSSKSR